MPKWVHDRAEHILSKNPSMPKSQAFAIATQQSHALGKSPRGYGTSEGRRVAKAKYSTPDDDKKKAKPDFVRSSKMEKRSATFEPSERTRELEKYRPRMRAATGALTGLAVGGLTALGTRSIPAGLMVGGAAGLGSASLQKMVDNASEKHFIRSSLSGANDAQFDPEGGFGRANDAILEHVHGREGPLSAGLGALVGGIHGGLATPGRARPLGILGGAALGGGVGYLGGKAGEHQNSLFKDLRDHRRAAMKTAQAALEFAAFSDELGKIAEEKDAGLTDALSRVGRVLTKEIPGTPRLFENAKQTVSKAVRGAAGPKSGPSSGFQAFQARRREMGV